jgi:hypothetical protein
MALPLRDEFCSGTGTLSVRELEFALAHSRSEDTGYGIGNGKYRGVEGHAPGVEVAYGEVS